MPTRAKDHNALHAVSPSVDTTFESVLGALVVMSLTARVSGRSSTHSNLILEQCAVRNTARHCSLPRGRTGASDLAMEVPQASCMLTFSLGDEWTRAAFAIRSDHEVQARNLGNWKRMGEWIWRFARFRSVLVYKGALPCIMHSRRRSWEGLRLEKFTRRMLSIPGH
jgi:hypothetical protein